METLKTTFRLAWDALLLRDRAFEAMRDAPNAFARGLSFILAIAIVVSLLGVIGSVLTWLTSPDLGRIEAVVWDHVSQMPWVEQVPPSERAQALAMARRIYDLTWLSIRALAPSIPNALIRVILNPIALVIGWLAYGFLAFLIARALGGQGGLGQTYGATALAAAPRLLGVVHVLPYVETAGLGVWALVCNYQALKVTHRLSPWRTFWATVLPLILLFLFVFGLAVIGMVIVMSLLRGTFSPAAQVLPGLDPFALAVALLEGGAR